MQEQWHFNSTKADLVVEFIETQLCHVEGHLGGSLFILPQWQRQLIRNIFGWQDENGLRKYRHVWIELPVRNGKTTLVAAILAWCLFCEKEYGQQCYSAGMTREQASLLYKILERMIQANPALDSRAKTLPTIKQITNTDNGATYRSLCADAANVQGINANVVVIDETQEQKKRDLIDALVQRTGSRQQPLVIYIGTSGFDRRSPAWELHQHAIAVRDGLVKDERFLPCIFAADENADPFDEKTWQAANPNLGSAVQLEYLRQESEKAKRSPLYLNEFRRKHLCQWTESESRFIDLTQWRRGRVDELPDLEGASGALAFDLANRRDLTSVVCALQKDGKIYLVDKSFIPSVRADRREQQDRVPYTKWKDHVVLTDGNVIDPDVVLAYILECCGKYEIHSIGYDPYQGTKIEIELAKLELNVAPIRQGSVSMNAPTRGYECEIVSDNLRHCSPVLDWQAANLCVVSDNNNLIRPSKPPYDDPARIDCQVAAIMAVSLLPKEPEEFQAGVIMF